MEEKEIPKEFYSFENEAPFDHCIECEKYLLDGDTEYIIEKAIRNYQGYNAKDVIFDYAICMECADQMRKEISKESWQAMMNYFQNNLDIQHRMELFNESPSEVFSSCMIKKTPMEECQEYQIYAHCKGDKLNMSNPPYMLSGEVMDELLPLLSEKTVDDMNGFMQKHFSPDPSIMEPTPPRFILL